jgi:hypothetical protein
MRFLKFKTATEGDVSAINLLRTRLRFYCCKLFNLLVKHPQEDATALLNTATNLTRKHFAADPQTTAQTMSRTF